MAFGIDDAIIAIVIATEVASAGAQMMSMQSSMLEQMEMMKNQELQNSYKDLSQKNQTLDQMKDALETNEAHMSATGMASNSGSFIAMNAETVEEGDKAMRNSDVAESLNDYSLKIQQQARQRQAYAQGIGNIAGTASSIASMGIGAYGSYKYIGMGSSINSNIYGMFKNSDMGAF